MGHCATASPLGQEFCPIVFKALVPGSYKGPERCLTNAPGMSPLQVQGVLGTTRAPMGSGAPRLAMTGGRTGEGHRIRYKF